MTDIVERLRSGEDGLEYAAADEIARLRGVIQEAAALVSERAAERHKHAAACQSDRSRKHMQIRADEAGQIVALLRARGNWV
jgi:hypothetical protein